MSDLIRRQDAIHAIEDMPNAYNGWSDTYDKACIIGVLEEIPSAEPKTGEWIEVEKDEYEGFSIVNMRCNQCRKYAYLVLPKGTKCVYDFCPNCGAKMGVNK